MPTNTRLRKKQQQLDTIAMLYELPAVATPEDILLAKEQSKIIDRVIDRRCNARDARVVRLRYGIGCEPHTLEQVGEQYGVCRERIAQIEHKACRKLGHPSAGLQRFAGQVTTRHRPAHRNLYVPQWKHDQRAKMDLEIEALARLAEQDRVQAIERERADARDRVKIAVALVRQRAFDLDPRHVALYAQALSRMLARQRGIVL